MRDIHKFQISGSHPGPAPSSAGPNTVGLCDSGTSHTLGLGLGLARQIGQVLNAFQSSLSGCKRSVMTWNNSLKKLSVIFKSFVFRAPVPPWLLRTFSHFELFSIRLTLNLFNSPNFLTNARVEELL